MKSKREILETFANSSNCSGIKCSECPYNSDEDCGLVPLHSTLIRLGAEVLLKNLKEQREFDPNKILTCVTADKAKVGMRGYFADSLEYLKSEFAVNHIHTLRRINEEYYCERFTDEDENWTLFYPIDEVEE